jgi:hypothetical protein
MVSVDLQCAGKLEEFHEEQSYPVGGTYDRGAGNRQQRAGAKIDTQGF